MTTAPGPRSAGFSGVLCLLVAAVATIAGLTQLLGTLAGDDGDATVLLRTAPGIELPPGVELDSAEQAARLEVDGLSLGLRLLTELGTVVLCVSLVVGALSLRSVLRGIRAGTPFAGSPARSLVVVAAAVLAGGTLPSLLDGLAAVTLVGRAGLEEDPAVAAVVDAPLLPALLAVLVLAVAAAFGQGRRLDADVRGLV